MLKIDTQGFDFEILKGAESCFKAQLIKNIVIEMNFVKLYSGQNTLGDVIDILILNGFKPVGLYYIFRDKNNEGISWCNMLFTLEG